MSPEVKPNLSTDVVDSVNATNVQVSVVVIAREVPNGPGTDEDYSHDTNGTRLACSMPCARSTLTLQMSA